MALTKVAHRAFLEYIYFIIYCCTEYQDMCHTYWFAKDLIICRSEGRRRRKPSGCGAETELLLRPKS